MDTKDIVAAVEEYSQQGGTKKGGHTLQTRRIVKALQLIGIKRSDFKARVIREWHRNKDTGARYYTYTEAIGNLRSQEGHQTVIDNAQLLNRCGISVHIVEGGWRPYAFVSTSHPYRTVRHNTATGETTIEVAR